MIVFSGLLQLDEVQETDADDTPPAPRKRLVMENLTDERLIFGLFRYVIVYANKYY